MDPHLDPQMKKDRKEKWKLKKLMSTTNSQFPSCDFTEVKFLQWKSNNEEQTDIIFLGYAKTNSKYAKDLLETQSAFWYPDSTD